MKFQLRTEKILISGIALLLLAIVIIIAVSISQSQQVNRTAKMVEHTQEVIIISEKLLSYAIDNETGSRGYVITGQKIFLEPYEKSQKKFYEELAILKKLTQKNEAVQQMIDSLSFYFDKRIQFSKRTIAARNQQGAAAAIAIIETGEGRWYTDQLRRISNNIEETENRLLKQIRQVNEKKIDGLNKILISVIISLLILFSIFIQKIRMDFAEKKKAASDLEKLNAELEHRVQERTEEVLVSEKRFRALVENNEGIISLVDEKLNVFFRSASAARITGWTNEEYKKNNAAQYIHPDDLENLRTAMAEAAANPEKGISISMRVRHYNGNYIWLEGMIKNMLHDPSVRGIITNMRDVTRRREAEQKIIKANRLYFFISQINQMIVRSTDDTTVFKEACKIAVDLGKFSMAWIGMVDEETKKIIPVAYAGEEQGYLSATKTIAADDIIGSKGPAGIALSKGTYIICNDIENDLRMKHWKNEALSRGYLSCMVIPIKKFEKIAGIFSFYASEKNFFDVAEVTLLEEATGDVSFALEIFEKEALRKKAEATVLESEKRYHTLAEISPVGIFHTNADGFTTYVNPRWCQISGLSAEEALGNGWLKAVHEEDKIKLAKGWEQAVKTHDISFSEYRFIRSDGTTRWVIGQAIPERDPENRIVGYVGTTTDITERKNAEEAIKISNERFEMIARATNDAVFDLDLHTGESWHNQTFLQLFYSDNDTVKVKPDSVQWRAKLHPEDRERVIKKLDAAYAGTSNAWSDEFRFKKADGSYGIFYDRGYITRDLSGKAIRIIGSMTDITTLKKVEEKLKESEEKYRSLIEQASDAIFISDEKGNFLDVNESACNMLGYSKAALCTMKIEELYTATELSLRPIMQQELERGERTSIERNILHKNGSLIPVDITAKMLTDRRIVAIVRDISERKKAEQEIKKSNERFELIAKATHDGIWDWNLATNEVWGNEVHQQLYGLTVADPVPNYQEWIKRIHPDDREKTVKTLEETIDSDKESYVDEYRFYTENEGWMNVYGRTLIERNPEGKPVRLIGSMMDITDRKKTEELLKASEKRFKKMVENGNDAFVILTPEGKPIYISSSVERVLGYKEDEAAALDLFTLTHPDDREEVQKTFIKALENPGVPIAGFTSRLLHKDGTWRWFEDTITNMIDDPDIGGIVDNFRDVTERKKTEEAIKSSEEKRRLIMNAALDAIICIDTRGTITFWNPQAEAIFGWQEHEVMGRVLSQIIIPAPYREMHDKGMEHYLKTGQGNALNTLLELKAINRRKKEFPVELTVLPIRQGNEEFFCAFIRDISKRKKAEEAIKISEEKYRSLVEQASDAIFIADTSGRFVTVNTSACKLSQHSEAELLQMTIYDFALLEDLQREPFHFEELKRGKTVVTERVMKVNEGLVLQIEVTAKLLSDGRLLAFIRDISERVKAQEEIKQTSEKLRQLTAHLQRIREDERKRIGREIHDELGQQLTAIKMDVAWIDKKTPDEKTLEKSKLKNIISLLDGSNQSVRRILSELRPAILDDYGLVEALEWLHKQFTLSTSIAVDFINKENELKLPEPIATCIFRICQEAFTNITKYSQADKVLTSVSIVHDTVLVTIEDNGKGFDTASVQNKKSFGILGMKERILSLNGSFELVSKPGEGTKITITLPL